ncbi:hypothetical protein HPP92_024225 [Vanilla planifolia]|uniref:Phospholipase D C-terminal domain-containing protein n=1 Tax=Vanilla planifolia TaxID=51239 RepID=A0A835PP69_VANPL|nr:hypothetical protein HPP92_024541 [Vanilla planifolia]KAG0456437.1 hypothetical protein HPP92_024225 [Vanilla planifolia]
MDGERDTEIALGCRQAGGNGNRRGDIFAYRTSLWYEHTRRFEAKFAEPESFECVKMLREIGEDMWRKYSGEEAIDMEGVHLVNYPVSVSAEGLVKDLQEGGGTFPDTTARVRGRRSKVLPPICTTWNGNAWLLIQKKCDF